MTSPANAAGVINSASAQTAELVCATLKIFDMSDPLVPARTLDGAAVSCSLVKRTPARFNGQSPAAFKSLGGIIFEQIEKVSENRTAIAVS